MKHAFAPALLCIAACSQQPTMPPTNELTPANAVENQAPLTPPAPGQPGGLPDDRTPVADGSINPKSAQGAAQVLQRYFALLQEGKTADADALWTEPGTPSEFAAQLAGFREIHANIAAPGPMEGAAGSSYVDVALQFYGRTNTGAQFSRTGTATLRRVNDVPGSTDEQRQWHIYRIVLQPDASPVPGRN